MLESPNTIYRYNHLSNMRIIGTNQGQRGDLIMGTVVARAIKERFPDSSFTLGINKLYEDMKPLFYNHPYIDDIVIWENYDNWPSVNDVRKAYEYNLILNPMPQHPNSHCWYNLVKHQTEASCIMNGLTPPKDLSCHLNKYFGPIDKFKDYIAISPFTAWERKNISLQKWQSIINYIDSKGFQVLELDAPRAPERGWFNRTFYPNSPIYSWPPWDYFYSVKAMLSCKFLICLDGGLSWVASAYKFPVLGLYGYHYDGLISPKVYEPINPDAIYLEAGKAEDIPNELIFKKIDEMIKKI